MSSQGCRLVVTLAIASSSMVASGLPEQRDAALAHDVLAAMKRATVFMVETVSTNGGYVWSYLPDLSRRWGELEARPTMIWIQPPGTTTMGHLFLDAYHATGDEYYYEAATKVAGALVRGQHASGGWNYAVDFAGERSLRDWYATVGRNAWRMEEFQKDWGNATFDDGGTADAARFLLRLYVEKRDVTFKPALEKAIAFVLASQSSLGAWPQRFPPPDEPLYDAAGYTSYLTLNDDVGASNVELLTQCYQALGDTRLLDPIARGMRAFRALQQPAPQPGWALQYTPDLKPAAARSYEPRALATHTSARSVELLVRFYRLTGDAAFLERVPEAIDWLDKLTLPPGIAPPGRTHATFIEVGTNKPLYVHRRGSNVVNGRYYVDDSPAKTLGHYSAFRRVDVAALRRQYEEARAMPATEITKQSPLRAPPGSIPLPRFFALTPSTTAAADVMASLNAHGYWLVSLRTNSHPYRGNGSPTAAAGDYSQAHVGDDSDTSPYPDDRIMGISTAAYVRNMSVLIRALARNP